MPEATRLYLGDCPKCEDGLAIFTSVWVQGKEEMLTVVDCMDCDAQIAATVNAKQASGQPPWLAALYQSAGLDMDIGPVYSITENCPLTQTDG